MITTETSHKLAEIIRDTWPNLYRTGKIVHNNQKILGDKQTMGGSYGKKY